VSIRLRVVLALAAILVLAAASVGAFVWATARRNAALSQLLAAVERRVVLHSLQRELEELQRATPAPAGATLERAGRLTRMLQTLAHAEARARGAAIASAWERFAAAAAAGGAAAPGPLLAAVAAEVDAGLADERERVDRARASFAAVERFTTRVGIAVFGTSTVIAVALAIALSIRLSLGLAHLKHGARVIGRGNLAYRIHLTSSDELGDFATAFNEMAAQLQAARHELEEARAAAEAASQAKGSFLARMSHELRTPLNAIIGYSEMLREDAEATGNAALAGDLEKIKKSGTHLLAMINEVLDLAKIEAGKMTVRLERFAIAPLVREVAAAITPLSRENGNALKVAADGDLGDMHADATKVRQVLFNLLGNACKFTRNGTITLAAQRVADGESARIVFAVTDTGVGMTPEQLASAFREFEQGGPAAVHVEGGTGLGLAISQRLCRLMGGDLLAESEPGKGTTFRAVIPAEAAGHGG
jgi:signal transduction histidine kinase